MGRDERKNHEGYPDPTPYYALSRIKREEKKVRQIKKILCEMCSLSGFRLKGEIVLVNKKNGISYRL